MTGGLVGRELVERAVFPESAWRALHDLVYISLQIEFIISAGAASIVRQFLQERFKVH